MNVIYRNNLPSSRSRCLPALLATEQFLKREARMEITCSSCSSIDTPKINQSIRTSCSSTDSPEIKKSGLHAPARIPVLLKINQSIRFLCSSIDTPKINQSIRTSCSSTDTPEIKKIWTSCSCTDTGTPKNQSINQSDFYAPLLRLLKSINQSERHALLRILLREGGEIRPLKG
jgi:hypothetical protein